MSQAVATKPVRKKKQSTFEKLWARAIKQKKNNEKFAVELAAVTERMRETILPVEIQHAKAQMPLLQKLLKLGQRKSMTNWERHSLDDWIRSMVEDFHQLNLVDDELRDHLAHYDAFRMGIQLEDETIPPHQQFAEKIRQAEEAEQRAREREQQARSEQMNDVRAQMMKEAHLEIEKALDKTLGPRPELAVSPTADLWEDELSFVHEEALAKYDKERETLREKLLADKLDFIDKDLRLLSGESYDDVFESSDFNEFLEALIDDDDDCGFSFKDPHESVDSAQDDNALSNETFQRLFRATAAKLHPDREPDEDVRLEKQKHMVTLLKARKGGDLLTVLNLYETWVGEHEGFSKADKKTLEATLRAWLDKLEDEKEEIIMESPLHFRSYNSFYHGTRKKIDDAFTDRLKDLEDASVVIDVLTAEITSLKTLKPWLEDRYDHMMENSFTF